MLCENRSKNEARLKNPENIIVRMPNWLGDFVMGTPVLSLLKKAFPKAKLTVMCLSSLTELLTDDPRIDELFGFHKEQNIYLRKKEGFRVIDKLKEGRYDLGILLTNSFSSAWWFYRGGVKNRIGYQGHFRRFLLSKALKPVQEVHQVDQYKALLKPLGIEDSKAAPKLYVPKEKKEEVQKLLSKGGFQKGQKLIGMNPTAAYGPAKCWPEKRYKELAKRLLEDQETFILFFGDDKGFEMVKRIADGMDERVLNLAGVTSLQELTALIGELDLLVTNDSGPMHIGAALDTPLIAIFGSTDPKLTGPYQKNGVIQKSVFCSPCFKRVCPIDFRCMKQISVEEVYQKSLAILQKHV